MKKEVKVGLKPVPDHILLKRELVNVLEGAIESFENKKIDGFRLFLEAVNVWETAKQNPFLNLAIQVELTKRRGVFNEEREVVEQETIEEMHNPINWGFMVREESAVSPEEFVLQRTIRLKELFESLFED